MKKSGLLQRIQTEREQSNRLTMRFTRQTMMDCAMIALNREFGFGADRLIRFQDAVKKVYCDFAEVWNADDPDTEYARAKLDEALKRICGQYFAPWEERYQ